MDRQGIEQFWTQNKQRDTFNNQIRFPINRKVYFTRPWYFGPF